MGGLWKIARHPEAEVMAEAQRRLGFEIAGGGCCLLETGDEVTHKLRSRVRKNPRLLLFGGALEVSHGFDGVKRWR
jgi:hypothetical protein